MATHEDVDCQLMRQTDPRLPTVDGRSVNCPSVPAGTYSSGHGQDGSEVPRADRGGLCRL